MLWFVSYMRDDPSYMIVFRYIQIVCNDISLWIIMEGRMGEIVWGFVSIGSNYVQDYQAASNKNVVQICAHDALLE